MDLWVVVAAAKDVRDEWVAHVLEFDLVTQGTSVQHAFSMAREAVEMCLADDSSVGIDPFSHVAPNVFWEDFSNMLAKSVAIESIDGAPTDRTMIFIGQIVLDGLATKSVSGLRMATARC